MRAVEQVGSRYPCKEWRDCLGTSSTKDTLLHFLKALVLVDVKPVAQTLVQSKSITGGNCDDDTNTCINPHNVDFEACDCEYLKWLEQATKSQIVAKVCSDTDGYASVCCAWKTAKCAGFTSNPGLLQRSQSQQNLTEKRGSQDVASLDDSLSGKRTC